MKCKSCGHNTLNLGVQEFSDYLIRDKTMVEEEPVEVGKVTLLWTCHACGYQEDETLNTDEWEALKKELKIK